MTKHRDFKALVRERMQKTGERYTAARAQLASQTSVTSPSPQTFPGVLPGYGTFGGIQSGTAALRNALASAGRVSPLDGAPYTESMINGLCGGPGFLYAVFEYKGWPPMLSLALRSRSMPDVYIAEGLSRMGMNVTISETTSPVVARKALDAALADGKAALSVTDAASLPWTSLPKAFIGGGPHVVAVAGVVAGERGDEFWIDDRAAHPRRISASQLSAARAAYRQAKNRLDVIRRPQAGIRRETGDSRRDRRHGEALCRTGGAEILLGQLRILGPRQVASDAGGSEGQTRVAGGLLPRARRACVGTATAARVDRESLGAASWARGLYADFLVDAARALGAPPLAKAAATYREAGVLWASIGDIVCRLRRPGGSEGVRDADERRREEATMAAATRP